MRPNVLVCDEAVAALDVSVQAQVLNLFIALRREMRLGYLFISNNLAMVERFADRVLVMYHGQIVESAPANELFLRPAPLYAGAVERDSVARWRRARIYRSRGNCRLR